MPTYEYTCAKCNATFETVQSITASALKVCPKELCPKKTWGKGKVTRSVGGGSGLIFKGSGFYITDYRSDKYKAAASKDSSSSSSGSSSGGKAESAGSSSTPAKPAAPAAAPAVAPKPAPKKD